MGRLGLGLGIGVASRRKGAGAPYDADAQAYFAAMTASPDADRKALLDALIAGLKADGVWAKLDWISLFAAHDAQAARLNAKYPAQAFSVVGAPAFVADGGYTGASGAYLASGWIPATSAVQYARNSAFVAAWSRTNALASTVALGNTATILAPRASDGIRVLVNGPGTNQLAPVPGNTSVGLTAADRSAGAVGSVYKNGVETGANAIANASSALSSEQFFALGRNVSGALAAADTARQYAAVCWGAHLAPAQHLALYNRLNAYLVAVGAA
jgi:hypothetical protein